MPCYDLRYCFAPLSVEVIHIIRLYMGIFCLVEGDSQVYYRVHTKGKHEILKEDWKAFSYVWKIMSYIMDQGFFGFYHLYGPYPSASLQIMFVLYA